MLIKYADDRYRVYDNESALTENDMSGKLRK